MRADYAGHARGAGFAIQAFGGHCLTWVDVIKFIDREDFDHVVSSCVPSGGLAGRAGINKILIFTRCFRLNNLVNFVNSQL